MLRFTYRLILALLVGTGLSTIPVGSLFHHVDSASEQAHMRVIGNAYNDQVAYVQGYDDGLALMAGTPWLSGADTCLDFVDHLDEHDHAQPVYLTGCQAAMTGTYAPPKWRQ